MAVSPAETPMPFAPRPIASVANGATVKPAAGTADRTTNGQSAAGNRARLVQLVHFLAQAVPGRLCLLPHDATWFPMPCSQRPGTMAL
jgi:hypothetical protein